MLFSSRAVAAEEYFQGKTIRLLVAFPVGGDIDSLSRILANGMTKHIPGKPNIVVENKPGAGGALALNYVYNAAAPDGLTILGMGSSSVVDQLLRPASVKFDIARFEYLGGAGPILQMVASRGDSPIKTIDDLGNVGRAVAIAGGGPGSTSTIVARILKRQYPNAIVSVGYLGESDRYKALLMGEADAALVAASYLRSEKAGLRPLVWLHGKAANSGDAPTFEELPLSPETRAFIKVITAPAQYGRTYLAPPGTPREYMAVIQKAFELTIKDPEFLKLAARIGADDLEWQGPQRVQTGYSQMLATPVEALRGLRELLHMAE
jgi:tripartite-type tricarboxylate transporter receptor subunit TctC